MGRVPPPPPPELKIRERTRVYEWTHKQGHGRVTRAAPERPEDPAALEAWKERKKEEEAEATLREWQQRWDQDRYGRWTYRFLPNMRQWIEYGMGQGGPTPMLK